MSRRKANFRCTTADRIRVCQALLLTLSLTTAAVISAPAAAALRADNFVLLDHLGQARELYYHADAPAVVLVAHSAACANHGNWLSSVQAMTREYPELPILLINAEDPRSELAQFADREALTQPVLQDSAAVVSPQLQLNHGGDAVIIRPADWQILFRGPITAPEASATLADLMNGAVTRTVEMSSEPDTDRCALNYPTVAQVPDYATEIAPVLERNCRVCHVEGGIAPWAMSEYLMIKGFAPMMREVVRVKRMPPWHADPEVGHWQNSAGMSDADTRTLINWIEAGAPRGQGEDPLLAARQVQPEWPLGVPDLVLEIPSYDIPASGIVDYQFPVVDNPLDRDVWVVAATIAPGNTQVVHHVLMGSADQAPAEKDRESVFENYIMGYAPGNESAHMPEGTGVFVPVGGVYLFQMHYTPIGVATTDSTRVALYFADEPPENFLRQQVVLNPRIRIPANAENHVETAYFEFWDDATIHSLVPHSHYRGKSSTFELHYPDGSTELILSVPNYDFNWQRTYSFSEPKAVPKGTRIVHSTTYDNSDKNPSNPDPGREVPWGLQSHDEMLYGSVSFSWDNESADAPMHSNLTAGSAQFVGFMDKDMDGKLSKEELPSRMRERLGWFKWWFVDTNFDGGLDVEEIEAMFSGD